MLSQVPAVNYHLLRRCDAACRFCFATFRDVDGQLGLDEPTLHPHIIDGARFREFVDRHAPLAEEGFAPVVEDNDAMRGSYAMIDPLGRFYGNATGRHVYSEPILDAGVAGALAQVGFEPSKFDARGGRYVW